MEFNPVEKLAIVQAISSVVLADGKVHNGEIHALSKLMHRIDFDSNFMVQARSIDAEQGVFILSGMPDKKKKALAEILEEVAASDGFVHEKETALMSSIFSS
ncbi:MAG: TerB family tellurite resistance protein, partial [Flavobacteriaceae bacterium]